METLVRSAAACQPQPVEAMDGYGELAEKAHKFLGYQCSREVLRDAQRQSTNVSYSNKIRVILASLDNPPFVPKAVERYKKRKQGQAIPLKDKFFDVLVYLVIVAGISFVISGVVALATGWEFLVWIVVPSLVTAIASFLIIGKFSPEVTEVVWKGIPIAEYTRPIPDFVLETAIGLKMQFPELEFVIEELEVSEQTLPDPFLRVNLPDGTHYYLEVWNEPGFRGKRML